MSLTDEDKHWIAAQLGRDKQLITTQLGRDKQSITAHIERVETALTAHIERVETALLTEFHKWASPLEMRVRSHAAALRALDLEVEAVSERVTKLEDR